MQGFINPFKGRVALPPFAQRHRFRRFRDSSQLGIYILCFLLIVAFPTFIIAARPTYVAFKAWRAERLTAAAELLVQDGQWEAAVAKASAAYMLAPGQPRNARLLAQVFSHFGSEQALDFWQLALDSEPADYGIRRSMIEYALQFQQLELAQTHAADLLRREPGARENLLLSARVFSAARDHAQELKTLRQAQELWPEDAEIASLIDRVVAAVGSDAEVRKALARLRETATREDQLGLDVLDFFLKRPPEDFPDRHRLAVLLRGHPSATGAHLVPACAVELDASPADREAKLDRLVEAALARDAATRVAVADWLLRLGDFRRVMRVVPWPEALESAQLTLSHLDALSRTGDLETVERVLATPGIKLRKELAHLCRWQAKHISQGAGATDHDAVAAMESAGAYPASLAYIAAHFEDAGRDDLASQTYSRLRQVSKFRRVALLGLLRIAHRARDTKAIVRLLEQGRGEGLADAAALGEIAYYQLLLKKNVRQNRQLAARLAAEYPDRIIFFSTLALACLIEEDFSGAMKAFEDCGFRWRRATGSMKAVYAATLTASGRAMEAREVIRDLATESLLPEERALLGAFREPQLSINDREL